MQVAVTTIMLNESPAFIERWYESCKDADHCILVDTGSINEAVDYARELGISVFEISVKPWRFDVARNTNLALLPPDVDVVVTLDVDEVISDNWRVNLERAGSANEYTYIYNWSPDVTFRGNRIHSRYGWLWRHPCHETLYYQGGLYTTANTDIVITHLPDHTKSRSNYLQLLEVAVQEDPQNDRMAHYYARELYFQGQWERARVEFTRHLSLPTTQWAAERCQSYRYLAMMDDYPLRWILHAIAECPNRREPYIDAMLYHKKTGSDIKIVEGYAYQALAITENPLDYMTETKCWNDQWILEQLNLDT